MTRPPGDDPAAFAIELETLARKAFVDVDASVRLQLVSDSFIIGQEVPRTTGEKERHYEA